MFHLIGKIVRMLGWIGFVTLATTPSWSVEVMIKDVTTVDGDRGNRLTGIGLVVGLNGTGGKEPMTREFMQDLLMRFGKPIDPVLRSALRTNNQLRTTSMSVVAVEGWLKTTSQPGTIMDVHVASMDGASDLQNGILISTPLLGADREVYAVADGKVNTGGRAASGQAATVQKGHPTTGVSTAVVERRIPGCDLPRTEVRLLLNDPDYTTAIRIRDAINERFPDTAQALESGIVQVRIPEAFVSDQVHFTSLIQMEKVRPEVRAQVIINEQTGTVVITENVRITPAAISHANISVFTGESPLVSQPLPFSEGETTVVPRTEVEINEERSPFTLIGDATTIRDLIEALNILGVSPQDYGSIFRALKGAGSLHAEIVDQ